MEDFPHSLVVKGEKVDFQVRLRGEGETERFSVDIYERGPHVHPQRHLGYWTFPLCLEKGEAAVLDVSVDLYRGFPGETVALRKGGEELAPLDSWFNPDFVVPPVLDVDLVLAGKSGEEKERVYIGCYVHDRDLLKSYYSREEHQEAYSDETNVFLQVFHQARVRVLRKLFKRWFADAERVLDVGSGYSMFRCMDTRWPFEVTCCDLDEPALKVIEEEEGDGYRCVVCDAADFPFRDGEFDGLFAGEILEHVVDPVAALREWKRVVKGGGVLIVTTPNRDRLINRVNRAADVVNPEHISELSYRELWDLFEEEGLTVLESRGIYIEFLFNYFRRGKKLDLLPARFNHPRFRLLFHAAMAAGNLFRPLAYNLVFVVRKGEGDDGGRRWTWTRRRKKKGGGV
jgi:SAM-dependent methyltransferase